MGVTIGGMSTANFGNLALRLAEDRRRDELFELEKQERIAKAAQSRFNGIAGPFGGRKPNFSSPFSDDRKRRARKEKLGRGTLPGEEISGGFGKSKSQRALEDAFVGSFTEADQKAFGAAAKRAADANVPISTKDLALNVQGDRVRRKEAAFNQAAKAKQEEALFERGMKRGKFALDVAKERRIAENADFDKRFRVMSEQFDQANRSMNLRARIGTLRLSEKQFENGKREFERLMKERGDARTAKQKAANDAQLRAAAKANLDAVTKNIAAVDEMLENEKLQDAERQELEMMRRNYLTARNAFRLQAGISTGPKGEEFLSDSLGRFGDIKSTVAKRTADAEIALKKKDKLLDPLRETRKRFQQPSSDANAFNLIDHARESLRKGLDQDGVIDDALIGRMESMPEGRMLIDMLEEGLDFLTPQGHDALGLPVNLTGNASLKDIEGGIDEWVANYFFKMPKTRDGFEFGSFLDRASSGKEEIERLKDVVPERGELTEVDREMIMRGRGFSIPKIRKLLKKFVRERYIQQKAFTGPK